MYSFERITDCFSLILTKLQSVASVYFCSAQLFRALKSSWKIHPTLYQEHPSVSWKWMWMPNRSRHIKCSIQKQLCRIMYGLQWIPISVTSEAIRHWFLRVTKSRRKIISESPHRCIMKDGIHGNPYTIFSYTLFMAWFSTQSCKSNHQRIVCSDLALSRRHSSICDVKRMRGTDIMPCSSIVLARANWHKGDLH